MKRNGKARFVRRCVQAASLALFLSLLFATAWPLAALWVPQDAYLRLDPLVALLVPVTAREWIARLWPGVLCIAAGLVFGRVFCGYICPMGVTLDLARRLFRFFSADHNDAKQAPLSPRRRGTKYLILAAVAAGAALGVNFLFWGSPIALVTRLYALLLHPLLLLTGAAALELGQPVFAALDMPGLAYAGLAPRRFDTVYYVLAFFTALFILERFSPRFWCRCLCPAGALLALAAFRPLWRRAVTQCAGCGRCERQCPTGAILPGGRECRHAECIACHTCVAVCPVNGVAFRFSSGEIRPAAQRRRDVDGESAAIPSRLPSRRAFLGATGAGIVLTGVQYSGKSSFLAPKSLGNPWSASLLRPPGALPEHSFLDRCIRCGQCMKACPENALQPAWFEAGVEGMFSPVLVPRRGPCEPDCNVCGAVCPTQAIFSLPLEEKQRAKVGTAAVLHHRCLAWAEGKRCMVCQEVCPYGSVRIVRKAGQAVPVPVVDSMRCFGCGYCEYHCPTNAPSIRVEPLNALRLETGEYRDAARTLGYILEPGAHGSIPPEEEAPLRDSEPPPGFSS